MTNSNPLLSKPKTLNPYRKAASLIKSRLLWDLKPSAWISRRRLARYQNLYPGGKAVILCNGPSLLKVDFDLLKSSGVYVFGLNKINLLFDKTDLRPSCVVSVNPYVIEQNLEFFNSTDIPLFVDSNACGKGLRLRESVQYVHSTGMRGEFARDCTWSLFQGHTVTYVALQLAFHMGFSEVALVGCDHSFTSKGPANKTVESGEVDPNHFDPNYFAGGVKWQLPDLFESEVAYKIANDYYVASGRAVYNATDGGALEIFPRKSLSEFLQA